MVDAFCFMKMLFRAMELPEPERGRTIGRRVQLAVVKAGGGEMIERFVLSTRDDLELFGRVFVSWLGGSLPPMTNCMVRRNNLDLIHNINLRFREMQPRL